MTGSLKKVIYRAEILAVAGARLLDDGSTLVGFGAEPQLSSNSPRRAGSLRTGTSLQTSFVVLLLQPISLRC
ncbi:MAG: hypothetical protein ACP5VR_11900 [Acidimicrobiales bacterium]